MMLSPVAEASLMGYSVDESIFFEYDTLSLSEFKDVLNFLHATYREAQNRKNLSGFHCDFGVCVGGKVYLLYLHVCLSKTGDKALM